MKQITKKEIDICIIREEQIRNIEREMQKNMQNIYIQKIKWFEEKTYRDLEVKKEINEALAVKYEALAANKQNMNEMAKERIEQDEKARKELVVSMKQKMPTFYKIYCTTIDFCKKSFTKDNVKMFLKFIKQKIKS